MEQGVYGGCLLCPFYPLLVFGIKTNVVPSHVFFKTMHVTFWKHKKMLL